MPCSYYHFSKNVCCSGHWGQCDWYCFILLSLNITLTYNSLNYDLFLHITLYDMILVIAHYLLPYKTTITTLNNNNLIDHKK